jgi:hypothetical protein
MFCSLIRNQASGKKRQPRSRTASPRVEVLEDRVVLTTPPIIYTTLHEVGDAGSTLSTAQNVPLAPMLETQILGTQSLRSNLDLFKVQLGQGQILTADISSSSGGGILGTRFPHLSLLDRSGVSQQARQAGKGQNIEFRVAQSGTYYVRVDWTGLARAAASYTLNIRPIGLENGTLDSTWLGRTEGGLYAWLDGSRLDVSGPVGHGFGIRGNWTGSVVFSGGLPGATYSADTIYLDTPLGEVPMPLPGGSPLKVTTGAQQWGDDFGEISSITWTAPSSLTPLEAVFAALNPSNFLAIAELNASTKIGIALGNDPTLTSTGAPLNAAIPYVYLSINPSTSGITQAFSVVVDPADPFMYIGSPQTGSIFPITAVGVSQSGLIPYTPEPNGKPSQWHGALHGHLYVAGTIDTTELTYVPSEVDGSLTLNLDPNHTGHWLGGSITPLQLANLLLAPQNPVTFLGDGPAVDQLFHNFSAGLNGELKISPWDKIQDIPGLTNRLGSATNYLSALLKMDVPRALTVAEASLIYDGPTESCYFRGGTVNPFEGTVAAPFVATSTVYVDAAIQPGGEFYLDAGGSYNLLGLTAHGDVKVLNSWPIQGPIIIIGPNGLPVPGLQTIYVTEVDADLNVSIPIASGGVDVHGQLTASGDFDLSGSATLNIFALTGSAQFDLKYSHTGTFLFTADVRAHYGDDVVRADLQVNIDINVDSYGDLTYSGSGTASVDVNTFVFGWQHVGDVGVGVSNHKIWFEADGHELDFYF